MIAAIALVLASAGLPLAAQPQILTIADAESLAVRNHPRVAAARLATQAAEETIKQSRTALLPFVAGNFTASVAEHGTRMGAANLNASSLFSRTAAGINITQTVFDFGRSRSVTSAAQSRASALNESASAVRAEILLRVREAYFRSLLATAQLRVVEETVQSRKVLLKHIGALVQSNLRSSLDASFAELAVAEAELMLDRAGNEQHAAMVQLSAALGYSDDRQFTLQQPPDPDPLSGDAGPLVTLAISSRPDLASLRLEERAARQSAETERRQALPTVSATGVGGAFGWRDERLRPHWGALGMNLNIPVFNGNLFASRHREANLKADIVAQAIRDAEIRISRDVRAAWIDARNAFQRQALTARVNDQAARTLRLAQSRYDLGLSSIAELTQAQLARTSAEVGVIAARFDYLLRRSLLDYQTGSLR